MLKKNKGITLISLIVTIIVLLILAGISISILTGENGILNRAGEAKKKTEQAQKEEKSTLAEYEDYINEYVTGVTVDQVTDENPGVLEGKGTESDPYVINSIEDLVFFSYDVRNGNTYEGQTVNLGLSLDFNSSKSYVDPFRTDYGKYGYNGELKTLLTSQEVGSLSIGSTVLGEDSLTFKGNFDGNNKSIYNMWINSNSKLGSCIGLFGSNLGTIANLKIENCKINYNHTETSLKCHVGGITGYNKGNIINCIVSGKIEGNLEEGSNNLRIGGIAGYNYEKIENCQNNAQIVANSHSTGQINIGGIAGSNNGYDPGGGDIINCINTGKIYSTGVSPIYIGGIAGVSAKKIQESENKGEIYSVSEKRIYAGGIVGSGASSEISNCNNNNNIYAEITDGDYIYVGGIVRVWYKCYNNKFKQLWKFKGNKKWQCLRNGRYIWD